MTKKIELTQGKFAIVDAEDYNELSKYNWHYAGGYARRNKRLKNGKRRMVFMHRIIANTPNQLFTDHINGETLDNRKANLRNVTKSQNAKNARKHSKATSKYKGVFYFKRKQDLIGKWGSRIQVDGKTKRLGYFNSEISAAIAYNEAARKLHKEFASLNEVETMDMHEYQQKASRTIPKEQWFNTKISNFCMGLSGESGEVVDNLKKVIHHGHELDRDELEKELGDVLWYLSSLATTLNMDLSMIAKRNIEKLGKRYPKGFSQADSRNRKG